MILFQIIIYISIFLCCKISKSIGDMVTGFWILITLVEVFMPWLMVIQFIVIASAWSSANGKKE